MADGSVPTQLFDGKEYNFLHVLLAMLSGEGLNELFKGQGNFLESLSSIFKQVGIDTSPFENMFKQEDSSLSSNFNSKVVNVDTSDRAALRSVISDSIQNTSKSLHGTRYKRGAKGGGSIDCSGFVAKTVKDVVKTANLDNAIAGKFVTNSEGQLLAMMKKGVPIMQDNAILQNLKAGLIITMDTGKKGWDAGRTYGTDHVVVTYEKDGEIYVAQSSGGKGVNDGVLAKDYITKKLNAGATLRAGDLVDVAQASTKEIAPETTLASNPAPDNTITMM
ncbi:MAG: hypothetical protein KDJ35_09510 [Alphaproteobacteria bacterium]|nr:hypothetical protein [Alphaproteobacteria bacterium]